jgi:hypothetical protein
MCLPDTQCRLSGARPPSPSKRNETPVPVILNGGLACQTHDARLRRTDTPSPSKENETPGTGDLEGRPPLHPHFVEPLPSRGSLRCIQPQRVALHGVLSCLRKRDLDDENRLPATTLPKAKNASSGSNDFNDLENRKSRGIPLRDTASRKRIDEALKFLESQPAWTASRDGKT